MDIQLKDITPKMLKVYILASCGINFYQNTIIMIGNSGAGKSTLLTSLVGGAHMFASGLSFGGETSSKLTIVPYDGTTYIDTPKLTHRLGNEAASQIERILMLGGTFRVLES